MMPLYSFFRDECYIDGEKNVTKKMMEQRKSQRTVKIKTHGDDCRCFYIHYLPNKSVGSFNLRYLQA